MFTLHTLPKYKKSVTRPGRGIAAGQGKTAGRGTKGQRSRTGKTRRLGFEGGQTPLQARIAKKRGFKSLKRKVGVVISQKMLAHMPQGSDNINPTILKKLGLLTKKSQKIHWKILGSRLQK